MHSETRCVCETTVCLTNDAYGCVILIYTDLQESSIKLKISQSPPDISTRVPVGQSTIVIASISPSLSQPRPGSAAKFPTSQPLPQPTTTLTSASVELQPTPKNNGCKETECKCQLRLDRLTLNTLLEDLQLLILLIVSVFLCILLCCFMTTCCVQCCVIRRRRKTSSSKVDSPAPVTNSAKAPSDENIYCDIAAAPPARRHHARHTTSSTGSLHELSVYTDGPQYCNTGVYRQSTSYPSNTF